MRQSRIAVGARRGRGVYVLSNAKAADAFAGQKVKVSGTLDAKAATIPVDAITAAA
jgi:hypothetical protein